MRNVNLSQVPVSDFSSREALAREAGVDFQDCYQCGKCTAGCPMSAGMDLMPREVMRYLQLGLVDEVLRAKTPWICVQCSVCSARCPQEVDIASVMRAVCHASAAAGNAPVRETDAFDDLFIGGVRRWGRSNEQYLAAGYNLATGHLLQDAGNAPQMLARGMIGLGVHGVQDRAAVRDIVDKALDRGGNTASGDAAPGDAPGAPPQEKAAGPSPQAVAAAGAAVAVAGFALARRSRRKGR